MTVPTDAKDLIHSGCHDKPCNSLNKTFAAPHHLSWLWPWQILGSLVLGQPLGLIMRFGLLAPLRSGVYYNTAHGPVEYSYTL